MWSIWSISSLTAAAESCPHTPSAPCRSPPARTCLLPSPYLQRLHAAFISGSIFSARRDTPATQIPSRSSLHHAALRVRAPRVRNRPQHVVRHVARHIAQRPRRRVRRITGARVMISVLKNVLSETCDRSPSFPADSSRTQRLAKTRSAPPSYAQPPYRRFARAVRPPIRVGPRQRHIPHAQRVILPQKPQRILNRVPRPQSPSAPPACVPVRPLNPSGLVTSSISPDASQPAASPRQLSSSVRRA